MPIQTDSLNRKLYDLLDSRGYDPIPMDADVSKAGKTVAPEEADVFKFTFKRGDKPIDTALVSIDGANKLTLYYDEELSKEGSLKTADTDIDDSWFGFLKFLKQWAFSKRLSWELEPKNKIDSDMAQRTYMKKKEQIAEGYYPMGKQASYSDVIPTVKIVLQHTRQIQEGEQRYRNVARIFLENTHGERILAPTTKPGIAQIYARHLAEGGVPNDERWNHIKSLCEEYSKMAGFVRAVRGNQFNESAQRLVEAGLNHYQGLRETLGKMRGHRGYNAYFESWTPTLMETEGDESNLNELFVQETLDPRIESVMPILSKLKLNLGEMKEVNELAEWADNLTEEPMPITKDEFRAKMKALQKIQLDPDTAKDPALKKELMKRLAQLKLRAKNAGIEVVEDEGRQALNPVGIPESEEVEESGLQAYLGNKKYGKEGMNALRKAGQEGASKEKMANIRAKYDKLDEEDMEEGEIPPEHRGPAPSTVPAYLRKAQGKNFPADLEKEKERNMSGPEGLAALKKRAGLEDYVGEEIEDDLMEFMDPDKRARLDDLIDQFRDATDPSDYGNDYNDPEDAIALIRTEFGDKIADQVAAGADKMHFGRHDYQPSDPLAWKTYRGKNRVTKGGKLFKQDSDYLKNTIKARYTNSGKSATEEGVAEDLDANQKRAGQLGPTEKVKNNNIGKLVGANESVELNEMDKSQPSSDRGGESSGDPYAKGGKATPVKSKDMDKDAEKTLNKSMDKAYKKDVKEGQEDLEAILRIIRK